MPEDILSQDVEAYDANAETNEEIVGGKKRRKGSIRRNGVHKKTKRKGTKRKGTKRKGTKRKGTTRKGTTIKGTKRKGHKKGPSKWIMHVKAYCRKTGKTFPEALKDPMCGKSFIH